MSASCRVTPRWARRGRREACRVGARVGQRRGRNAARAHASLAGRGHADRSFGTPRAHGPVHAGSTELAELRGLSTHGAFAAVLTFLERVAGGEHRKRAGVARRADRTDAVLAGARRATIGARLTDRRKLDASRVLARETVGAERVGTTRAVRWYLSATHAFVAPCVQGAELEDTTRVTDCEQRDTRPAAASPLSTLGVERTACAAEIGRASPTHTEPRWSRAVRVQLARTAFFSFGRGAASRHADQAHVARTRVAFVTQHDARSTQTTEPRLTSADEGAARLTLTRLAARAFVTEPTIPEVDERLRADITLAAGLSEITNAQTAVVVLRRPHAGEAIFTIEEAHARLSERKTSGAGGATRRRTVEAVRTKRRAGARIGITRRAGRQRTFDGGDASPWRKRFEGASVTRGGELGETPFRELGIQGDIRRKVFEPVVDPIGVTHGTGGESVPSLAADRAVALGLASGLQELEHFFGYFLGVASVTAVADSIAVEPRIGGSHSVGSVSCIGARRTGAGTSRQKNQGERGREATHGSVYHGANEAANMTYWLSRKCIEWPGGCVGDRDHARSGRRV